jgi:hypothetical protein
MLCAIEAKRNRRSFKYLLNECNLQGEEVNPKEINIQWVAHCKAVHAAVLAV